MFPFNALELSKDEEVMKGWSRNQKQIKKKKRKNPIQEIS